MKKSILALNSNQNKLGLILRITAAALLIIAFFMLFISYSTEVRASVTSGGKTISSKSAPTSPHNFFDRMGNEEYKRFGVTTDMMLVIFLLLSIAGAALLIFIDKPALNFILSALPLVTVVFCILYMDKSDVWYVINTSSVGSLYGSSVREDTSIRFYNSILPTMIPAILAFISMIASAIVSRKEKTGVPASSASVGFGDTLV